jgi:hypothetical protein
VRHAAQRGIALMMAMIALVAMSLAAMALLRSVDTGNTIAGNVAFRQAASQAADVGVEAAFTNITATLALPADLNANHPSGCTTACTYYATQQTVLSTTAAQIAADLPDVVNDWSPIPAISTTGLSIDGVYTIKYVVERLCTTTAINIDNVADVCFVTPRDSRCASHDAAAAAPCPYLQGTYFRASFFVQGPRNTKSYSQASFVRYVSY